MCYHKKPRCPKHGYKDSMVVNWAGNRMTAKCPEQGCNHEFIMDQVITVDKTTGKEHISYQIIKDH
jgi:hypothetical protein